MSDILASKELALRHATFLRRYLLRTGCEVAKTTDEVGIFDAILFLESLSDETSDVQRSIDRNTAYERDIKALEQLARHLRYCVECGEVDVQACNEGRPLWDACFSERATPEKASGSPEDPICGAIVNGTLCTQPPEHDGECESSEKGSAGDV